MLILQHSSVRRFDLAGTFAGLMDLYERNYIGLRRLIPELPPAGVVCRSQVAGNLDVHLRVLERFAYTSELSLTYYFLRDAEAIAEPDVRVRIYHDARQAEVLSSHLRTWPDFQADPCPGLHNRWRANRFLYKWVHYCLHQGHCFQPVSGLDIETQPPLVMSAR